MKKHFLFLLSLFFCSNNLWAQLNDSVLVDCFGAIQEDMVKTVCHIVGYKNDSIMKKISHNSLKTFKDSIDGQDTLLAVITYAQSLAGTDVPTYWKNLRDTRRDFQYQLSKFYPNRETEIEKALQKYIKLIDDLRKECNTFNDDTTSTFELYSKAYPSGRFSKFVASTKKIKTSRSTQNHRNKEREKQDKKDMEYGLFNIIKALITLIIKVCLGFIVALIVIFVVFKKRKIIVSAIMNLFSKILNNKEVKGTEELKEQESKGDGVFSETDEHICGDEPLGTDKPEEKPLPQPKDSVRISSATDAGEWIVVGASVQGNAHIGLDVPCQDYHAYQYIKDGWGIAIVSDGAGSAKQSHIGSAASVERAMYHFKELIKSEEWIEKGFLPSESEWMKLSYKVLKTVRNELELLAKRNNCNIKDFSATIIVVIHSPLGLLVVHIGDGRAGYKDMNGVWHSLIIPHKGEEANQTIFIPSDFWNIPFYEMSGATVPESRIVRGQVSAFTLMSDGCESTSWLWNQYNEETGKYYDPNLPHSKFFDSLIETLRSFRKENTPLIERKVKWSQFIKEGNKSFVKETDDKTMILAALYM